MTKEKIGKLGNNHVMLSDEQGDRMIDKRDYVIIYDARWQKMTEKT